MSNSKCVYYKEKEQKSIDGGITWVDTGNFRKGALISTQASQCGSFVTEYKWVKTDYVCDNANKYKGYKQQVSHDNGGNWVDTGVVDIGSLIESNSRDCGYDEQWFVLTGDNDFICDGASKYKKKEMKYTIDSGTTWNSFDPPIYEKGDLIAQTSTDCASMKVTYTDGTTKYFANLTSIEQDTDSNKSNAKEVEIYDSVTIIGRDAFYNCKNLTGITIPNSVTRIGDAAFLNCNNLTGITIPNSVISIGYSAFGGCTSLTSIAIPDSVKWIGSEAFSYCSSLSSITIPNSVTGISDGAFEYCSNLKSITIPNSITEISDGAFSNSGLETMTVNATTPPQLGYHPIPNNIQIIYVPADSVEAYKSADGWKDYADKIWAIGTNPSMKVTYTDGTTKIFTGLTSIEENTDSNKDNAKIVEIYDRVKTIGNKAFYNCRSIISISIPNSVTSIGREAFNTCLNLTSVVIPNSVKTIGIFAFYYCNKLTSITLPNSLRSIGNNVLAGCRSLTGITIPNTVTSIGECAFMVCDSITDITIPENVKSIGQQAFETCSALRSITVKATTPPSLGSDAFYNTAFQTIYVPAASVNSYKSADGWKDYADKIQAIPE